MYICNPELWGCGPVLEGEWGSESSMGICPANTHNTGALIIGFSVDIGFKAQGLGFRI